MSIERECLIKAGQSEILTFTLKCDWACKIPLCMFKQYSSCVKYV